MKIVMIVIGASYYFLVGYYHEQLGALFVDHATNGYGYTLGFIPKSWILEWGYAIRHGEDSILSKIQMAGVGVCGAIYFAYEGIKKYRSELKELAGESS